MNRKLWGIIICLLGSFFVIGQSLGANSDIIINEIGAYPTSTHEWIEIWNKGSEPVDLTGWKFWENNTNHGLSVSTTDAVVAPGEYAAIVQDSFQFLLDYPSFSGSVFDSSWTSLNESGEEIGIKDAGGNFIEDFTYIPAPDDSLERRDPFLADYTAANWAENATGNTVGAVNSNFLAAVTTTTDSTSTDTQNNGVGGSPITYENWASLKLNEFVSDPDGGNEWVELYNLSSSDLDLAGGYICDSRNTTSTCKLINGNIAGNGWLKIDLQTDSYLNNDGDAVILKNPLGDVVDSVVYDANNAPDKGQSLARDVDGNGNWQITTQITPDAANIIAAPVSAQPSSGGGGSVSTASSSTTSKKSAVSKEKFVGLKWKIKYNLRLRQYEENTFSASSTLDPRGGRMDYAWNFGDQIILGASVQYVFSTSGIHTVIVRATSTAGTVDVKKINIMVYPATETAGSGIVFSKILPRAGSEEDEYIQLKNISSQTINMSNWKIIYKNGIYEIPTSTSLAAGDYLTFYQTITGFTLNNTGGDLLLLSQDNILMDEVEYGKADEGIAYEFDGQNWVWDVPTTTAKVLGIKINASAKKSSGNFFTKIADARGGQKGDYARIKGVVAVLPGVFGSQYFYIVDGNTGIQVYQNKKDFPPLEMGDLVQVYGAVSEASGIKRINVKSKDDIDILSIGNVVSSTQLSDEIDDSMAGALVQTSGEITEVKSNFIYLDNGNQELEIYFKQGASINKQGLKTGEKIQITGILEQTATGWQIWPRAQSDVEVLSGATGLSGEQAANNATSTQSRYLEATAGGLATLVLGFLLRARGLVMLGGIKKITGKFAKKE